MHDNMRDLEDGPGALSVGWAYTEVRQVSCVNSKKEQYKHDCAKAVEQVRPKAMKGRAWEVPMCPPCRAALDRSVAANEARAERQDAAEKYLRVLTVPPRYADCTLDNLEDHGGAENMQRLGKLRAASRDFIQRWPKVPGIVLFHGGTGAGKGHVSWAIAKSIVETHGEATRYVKLPDLIRELREGWKNPLADPESVVLERYREAPFLVVDEVSRHAYYGDVTPHLYHLLDHRLDWMRPTIVTTNEDLETLGEILTAPMLSRIQGERAVWDFGNVDHRVGEL